jgi:MFS family permease
MGGVLFFVLMELQSLLWLCIGAFGLSAFGDAYRPANSVAVSAFSKQETRTRAFTLQRLAINLGWSVGPALGGFLAVHAGYHYLFLVDGITNISAAFALWWLLGKYKQPNESQEPARDNTPPAVPQNANAYKDTFFLWYLFFGLLNALVFMQLFNNIPVFMKTEGGIREDLFGAAMAANGLVIALTEMPLVYLMERRFAVMRLISTGFVVIGASFALLWIFPINASMLWLFVLVNTVGEMICLPFFMSHIMNRVPAESRGTYMGMLGMMWSVAQVASPALGATLATHTGYQYTWMFMALMSVVAGLGILLLYRKQSEALA